MGCVNDFKVINDSKNICTIGQLYSCERTDFVHRKYVYLTVMSIIINKQKSLPLNVSTGLGSSPPDRIIICTACHFRLLKINSSIFNNDKECPQVSRSLFIYMRNQGRADIWTTVRESIVCTKMILMKV